MLLAHGGSDDGRRFFLEEAGDLARRGATVILPVTRFSEHGDIDEIATAIRHAVWTEPGAVDVLIHWAEVRSRTLCFLGHSAGSFLGAYLSAVEPRLTRVAGFGYGAGTFPRFARQQMREDGLTISNRVACAIEWFEPARYIGIPGDRAILVQHGRRDKEVLISGGLALFDAAAEPKAWAEYDCGHAIERNRRLAPIERILRSPRRVGELTWVS